MSSDDFPIERYLYAQYNNRVKSLEQLRDIDDGVLWCILPLPAEFGEGIRKGSTFFGISSEDEAKEFYEHEVLGRRLRCLCDLILSAQENDPVSLMGSEAAALHLHRSVSLFYRVAGEQDKRFEDILRVFFEGRPCEPAQ